MADTSLVLLGKRRMQILVFCVIIPFFSGRFKRFFFTAANFEAFGQKIRLMDWNDFHPIHQTYALVQQKTCRLPKAVIPSGGERGG